MSAEHIAWVACLVFLAITYACSLYVIIVSRREMREQDAEDFPHPHGHLPSDYIYGEER